MLTMQPHLLIRRLCSGCRGACCEKCNAGTIIQATDTTGAYYACAAKSLPELLARLVELVHDADKECSAAIRDGDLESTMIHAARRSGLAEAVVSLQGYILERPKHETKAG